MISRVCGHCGKKIAGQFKRHFKRLHTGIQPYEYVGASPPTNPWCDNWKEVLESNAKP